MRMELNEVENCYRPRCEFSCSQSRKQVLVHKEFIYKKNKTHQPKKGGAIVHWLCERNRNIRCPAKTTAYEDNRIISLPLTNHLHEPNIGHSKGKLTSHNVLVEANKRLETAPVALLNKSMTPIRHAYT